MDKLINKNDGISLLVFPFFSSCELTYFLVKAMLITEQWYYRRLTAFAIFLFIIWGGFFIYDQARGKIYYAKINTVITCVISYFLGLYLTFYVWGKYETHTLMPYWSIDNGLAAMDTLFHSAIAENFKHSMIPTSLINQSGFMRYHVVSHFIMGHLAQVLGVPTYISYNLIYPIVFFPLYIFSQIYVISCAKKYFEGNVTWQITDILVMVLFNVGFAYEGNYGGGEGFLLEYRAGRYGRLLSESFLVSNIFAFLFLGICFLYLEKNKGNQEEKCVNKSFLFAFIPISIFLITYSKISTGLMIAFALIWYILRNNKKGLSSRIGLSVLYFFEFVFTCLLANRNTTAGGPNSITEKFGLFATNEQFLGKYGLWGHWFVLSIMTTTFIFLELNKHHYKREDIRNGKTIWIEIMIISSVLLFLPGFLINIGGGSANFFSCLVEYEALILICGQKWYNDGKETKHIFELLTIVWCLGIVFTNLKENPLDDVFKYEPQGLSRQLQELYILTKDNPDEYIIYLDSDADVLNYGYPTERECFYLYPAYTGISVINATYDEGGLIYSFTGNLVGNYYNMGNTDNMHKISFNEACEKALLLEKKYMIHLKHNGYDIINLYR